MVFDYEQSIWGAGEASLSASNPTAIRLREALRALEGLPPRAAVVEVGSGAGQFIRAIKKIRPDLTCGGCDISERALAEARRLGGGVEYALSTSERLPYADNSQSAVLVFDVLEHVENPDQFTAELFRVLVPGGLLYAFVPCEGDSLSLWRLVRWRAPWRDLTKKHAGHIQSFSRKTLHELLVRAGFVKPVFRYSEHFFGQIVSLAAFWLMERAARRAGGRQINNEAYFSDAAARGGAVFRFVRRAVNSIVYWESRLWRRVPSPNVHCVAFKTPRV